MFADGAPIVAYGWLRGAFDLRRVTGCDILHALLRHPALPARRVMVIAESEATAGALPKWCGQRGLAPNWRVAVAPPDVEADTAGQSALVDEIGRFQPEILILTLGAPASEEFVYLNRAKLPPCWALCFGQAMRVELGMVRRAPHYIGKLGLEWAWRTLQEPRRLLPRYARAAAWFPRAVAQDLRR